jgi:hypothetical protein
MADSPKDPKKPKAPTASDAAAAKPRSRPKKPPPAAAGGLGEAGDDADLRTRVARRAYELSQSDGAAGDEENWLRAERELSGS